MSVIMLTQDEARRSVAHDRGRPARGLGGRPAVADDRAARRPAAGGAGARLDQRRQGRSTRRLPRPKRRGPARRAEGAARSSSASTATASGATSSSRTSRSPRTREDGQSAVAGSRAGARRRRGELGRALAPLPSDWTDLLCELEIDSSTLLDRAALLCAPLNPARTGSRLVFTFRCSGRSGYGVSPSMARRCFERLDDEGIVGHDPRSPRPLGHGQRRHPGARVARGRQDAVEPVPGERRSGNGHAAALEHGLAGVAAVDERSRGQR